MTDPSTGVTWPGDGLHWWDGYQWQPAALAPSGFTGRPVTGGLHLLWTTIAAVGWLTVGTHDIIAASAVTWPTPQARPQPSPRLSLRSRPQSRPGPEPDDRLGAWWSGPCDHDACADRVVLASGDPEQVAQRVALPLAATLTSLIDHIVPRRNTADA